MSLARDRIIDTSFVERLLQAKGVLTVYWLLVLGGFFVLFGTVVVYDGPDEIPSLLAFIVSSGLGVAVGQVLALARLRIWISFVFTGVNLVLMVSLGLFGAPGGEIFWLSWFGLVNGLVSGHASLSHRFGLAAAWIPIVFWVGTIIGILNEHGRVHEWQQDKVSAWLPLPLVLLFAVVTLLVAYLASKESHRLTLWQLLGSAPWRRTKVRRQVRRVRMRARGWVTLLGLAFVVFAATAVLSPYLWRTGPGDAGEETTEQDDWEKPKPGIDWDAVVEALRRAARGARDGATMLLPFIPLFLLNRPIRRLWLLWRLRRPFWPESPSRRIACLWEYVRIGLGDAGLAPRESDSVEDVLARAADAARQRGVGPSEALENAAAVYTRVRYGLGIRPGEVAALDGAARTAFRDVRAGMTGWSRFKSWFRKLD